MFVDEVTIEVKAGAGGNGASTFHREKYVSRGGPDGGDGGNGGSIYLQAESGLTTLLDFRYHHHFKAESGDHGQRSTKHGKQAQDLILKVPVGAIVLDDATGEVLADLVSEGQTALIVAGGRGGRGNARFTSATNQAPRFAENGEPGEERKVRLELKLLADVGLVGLPNAGKSSLLNRISAARPKIGDYPFTTLEPVLGVVSLGEFRSCVIADIPGLIEGAHKGLGLGHQFLRHIERTRMLIHVLDASTVSAKEAMRHYGVITSELAAHNPRLVGLPLLAAVNKIDVADPETVQNIVRLLAEIGVDALPISAATGAGIELLLHRIRERLPDRPPAPVGEDSVIFEAPRSRRPSRRWSVEQESDNSWRVTGEGLERLVAMTNIDNEAALQRLHRILENAGVLAALKSAGVQNGSRVIIRNTAFVFMEEEQAYGSRRRRKRAPTEDQEDDQQAPDQEDDQQAPDQNADQDRDPR